MPSAVPHQTVPTVEGLDAPWMHVDLLHPHAPGLQHLPSLAGLLNASQHAQQHAQLLALHTWSHLANSSSWVAVGSLGLGSAGSSDDGLSFVGWSVWINVPLVLYFMLREWPTYAQTAASRSAEAARTAEAARPGGVQARALVGRAIAGSVWSPHDVARESNVALGTSFSDLRAAYKQADRTSEMPDYKNLVPDTKDFVALARDAEAAAGAEAPVAEGRAPAAAALAMV